MMQHSEYAACRKEEKEKMERKEEGEERNIFKKINGMDRERTLKSSSEMQQMLCSRSAP
jgi:hypothetical protein